MTIDTEALVLMIAAPLVVAAIIAVSKLLVSMGQVQRDIQYIRSSTDSSAKRIGLLEQRVSKLEASKK